MSAPFPNPSSRNSSSPNPSSPATTPSRPFFHAALRLGSAFYRLRVRQAKRWNFVEQMVAYSGYGTPTRVRVLGRVLLASNHGAGGLTDRAAKTVVGNVRGWRAFTSVPVQNREVEIELGGELHRVRADRGGLIDTNVQVRLDPGWHTAVFRAAGTGPVEAPIFVIAPDTRFGIVSDIDDTVMVTALPRPFLALWNTFVVSEHARTPTPGMAVLMDRLAVEYPDAPVIYLSTGPWNAAPTLARFLARNMYPAGALLLTDWGLTQDRWFRSGREHKRRNLELLAKEFPGIRWLLIGDNGQHDEEIYAEFSRRHPDLTAAVAIRQLSVGESVLSGGRSADGYQDQPAPFTDWVYAPDGAGMAKQLRELRIF
ncbi:App1 family protein [Arthrobacter sp. A5]|uniref:App1 family protein n=1 Tax=Arthrobacter sp. A5 TaxID=576926 RepID=UPI003DA93185